MNRNAEPSPFQTVYTGRKFRFNCKLFNIGLIFLYSCDFGKKLISNYFLNLGLTGFPFKLGKLEIHQFLKHALKKFV